MKKVVWLCLLLALLVLLTASAEVKLPKDTAVIEAEAFMGDKSVKEVELPEGLVSIGERAFADSGVTRVTVPGTLEDIADNAFEGCSEALVIRGRCGSAVEDYCKAHGIDFAAISPRVGVALPTSEANYWNNVSNHMRERFLKAGIDYDIRYGQAQPERQLRQIRDMIAEKVDVLVFVPLQVDVIRDAIDDASKAGIKVIDYERLLPDSKAVDYFISFDNVGVGRLQGEYVQKTCNLDDLKGPLTIEFFAGPESDVNAKVFFDAAYAVLEPYIKAGKLVCPSGENTFKKAQTPGWMTENAQNRMKRLLKDFYPDAPRNASGPDIVLCANDTTAAGVIRALKEAGFEKKDMPVITGQDCDLENVRYIRDGLQSMTVFKDMDSSIDRMIETCLALLNGKTVKADGTVNNGAKDVPLLSGKLIAVTVKNYKSILIDSGIYSEAALRG